MIISIGPDSVTKCVEALREGKLIGLPTETVYGLAADATHDEAVASIFQAKGRPQFNPLILHAHSLDGLEDYAHFDRRARELANQFWPGPLTLVLPRKADSKLSLLVSAGLDTVAVRIPKHPVALEVLEAFGKPLAAPSANLSGTISPTCPKDVAAAFDEETVPYVLGGGICEVGLESTILDITGDQMVLLRPGGIAVEEISGDVHSYKGTDVKSPGMLKSHYAPRACVFLNETGPREGGAFLGFGDVGGQSHLNLSPSGDLKEAAANLFAMLRQLDAGRFKSISISPIPATGLGLAINDRICRAAIREST